MHVIMHEREVAILSSPRARTLELTYTEDAAAVTHGLSCSLPTAGGRYIGARVDNWISGLLPDRSEVLTRRLVEGSTKSRYDEDPTRICRRRPPCPSPV